MSSSLNERLQDIREINLSYLMLAQQMIRADMEASLFRLGVTAELAEIIANLTPSQVLKLSNSDKLLCQFRFGDSMIFELLTQHSRAQAETASHTAILMARSNVEDVV